MKVLLLGSGAREHALAWKLSQSPRLTKLLVGPGNPGTARVGTNVPLKADAPGDKVAQPAVAGWCVARWWMANQS